MVELPTPARSVRLLTAPPAIAALLALLTVGAFYGPGLATGRVLVPLDAGNGMLADEIQVMYPWRVFVHSEAAQGRLPVWNPYSGGGHPLLASGQAAVFFPLNIITLPMAPDVAATWVQMVKAPLAATGGALFLRALGLKGVASVFGGIAWAFSGAMVVWLGWPITNALLLVPWLFWTTTRWLQGHQLGWWLAHSALIALQLFGGHPESSLHTVFVLAIFAGTWLAADTLGSRNLAVLRRAAGSALLGMGVWTAGVALGGLLAAIQVVPLLEAIAHSSRAGDRSAADIFRVVLDARTALTWLVPNFFGTPLAQGFGPIFYTIYSNYNEAVAYAGLGTLVLASASLGRGRHRSSVALWILTIVSLGIAYGWPLLTEFRQLPGLDRALNVRFVGFAAFGFCCLAAMGLDACLQDRPRWARLGARVAAAVALAVALGLAVFSFLMIPSRADAAPLRPTQVLAWREGEMRKTAGVAGLWTLALIFSTMPALRDRGASALILVPLVVDLSLFGARYNPMVPRERVSQVPEVVRFLQGQPQDSRVIALAFGLVPNTAMQYGLSDLRIYDPAAPSRILSYFEAVDAAVATDPYSRGFKLVWRPNFDLLRVGGVRWVLVPRGHSSVPSPEALASAGLTARYANAEASVWEIPGAVGRAYFSESIAEAPDSRSTLATISGGSFIAGQQAVVERAPGDSRDLQAFSTLGHISAQGPEAALIRGTFTPGSALLRVAAPRRGLLVYNETFYPGWEVWVDGTREQLVRANYLFMGVLLGPGEHDVIFSYRPASILLGALLSATAILASLVLVIVNARARQDSDRIRNSTALALGLR